MTAVPDDVDLDAWSVYASQALLLRQHQIEQKVAQAGRLDEFVSSMKNWAALVRDASPPTDMKPQCVELYGIVTAFDLLKDVSPPRPLFSSPSRAAAGERGDEARQHSELLVELADRYGGAG